jgi:hypothetical protein
MPLFYFTGVDQDGTEQTGNIEAETLRHARSLLKSRGILTIKVDAVEEKITLYWIFFISKKTFIK